MAAAPSAAARPRPGGGRLFIIVGVLLAALAFGGVFLLGNLGGGGAVLSGATNSVVIAKQQIPLRHQITADDLELGKASVGGDAFLGNVYTSASQVVGKIAEINISKGAMISSDMLATDLNVVPTGAAPAFLPLASGYVAITIPTGEQQGVAGHISQGDYITVIASGDVSIFATSKSTTPTAQSKVSKTVFTGVRIIGLGPASSSVTSAAGSGATTTQQTGATTTGITSSLTIEMTQCDSEYMTWFLQNMNVKYTLESYKDYLAAPPSQPDASCPTVTAAGGVSNRQVDERYHFSTLVTGK